MSEELRVALNSLVDVMIKERINEIGDQQGKAYVRVHISDKKKPKELERFKRRGYK